MSASPTSGATAVASTKRPLEDPSSPSAPTDLPDAKRPALDKVAKAEEETANGAELVSTEIVKDKDLATSATANGAAESQTNGPATDTSPEVAIQPIPSSIAQTTDASGQSTSSQDETTWIHIRAVISSAEAATCIGKGGENVSLVRKMSGAKCTVSDYSRGQVERILTVSGTQDAVAKVCLLELCPDNSF